MPDHGNAGHLAAPDLATRQGALYLPVIRPHRCAGHRVHRKMWVTRVPGAVQALSSPFFSRISLVLWVYGFGLRIRMAFSTDDTAYRIAALTDPLREAAREAG